MLVGIIPYFLNKGTTNIHNNSISGTYPNIFLFHTILFLFVLVYNNIWLYILYNNSDKVDYNNTDKIFYNKRYSIPDMQKLPEKQ